MRPQLVLLAALLAATSTACSHTPPAPEPDRALLENPAARRSKPPRLLRGQPMPEHVLAARPEDFSPAPGVAALHYYGAGGWGIQWRGTYLLAAPYFSNHSVQRLFASRFSSSLPIVPDEEQVRAGFAGTPVGKTAAILIAHGHVDHTADVPAFFGEGLITGKPALIADLSTYNQLHAMKERFGCLAPIEYGDAEEVAKCPVEGMRITPIHHAHAPHLNVAGLDVAAFGGLVKEPQTELPSTADHFKVGNTWAFLIDLLDEEGEVAFRIHYVDAAASPPHGLVPRTLLAERGVDLHIACVPGFEESDSYPDTILSYHDVKYVLGGHWEDFLQPRSEPLQPLRLVLDDEAVARFVDRVEAAIPEGRGVAPINKAPADCAGAGVCGPRGAGWTLPVPGETFWFAAGAAGDGRIEGPPIPR